MEINRIPIAGVRVDNVSMSEAVSAVECLVTRGGRPAHVVTPNADHIVRIQKDEEFRTFYEKSDLALADGMPLVWASHFLGTPLKEKVSGSDLFYELCRRARDKKWRIFLLGGNPGSAELTKQNLERLYDGISVAGFWCPPFGFENQAAENETVIRLVQEARPDILFVALGTPKQEKWIYRHKEVLGVPVSIGIGATLEFASGAIPRAPRWMQNTGLEWFWRLLHEPRRLWRRYLVDDPVFFWLVLRQWIKRNFKPRGA